MLSKLIKKIKRTRQKAKNRLAKEKAIGVLSKKRSSMTFKVDEIHWEDRHWFI